VTWELFVSVLYIYPKLEHATLAKYSMKCQYAPMGALGIVSVLVASLNEPYNYPLPPPFHHKVQCNELFTATSLNLLKASFLFV